MVNVLLYQTVEVSDHLHFIKTALLCEEVNVNSVQFLDKGNLTATLAYLMDTLTGSTEPELYQIVQTAATLYNKYRRRYPFMQSPIRAFKNSGKIFRLM
jgi:hypothetical protein